MTRLFLFAFLLCACAPRRTPEQLALIKRGDCAELLRAADAARAAGDKRLARELAGACPQAGLESLVAATRAPAEAFLFCGRARAALVDRGTTPSCSPEKVVELQLALRPKLTLGPADSEAPADPFLQEALTAVGVELNLFYDHDDPMVFVGRVKVAVKRVESQTLARAPDPSGAQHRISATLHRVAARAECQVELGSRTRTIHATEEQRDVTWAAEPRFAIAAKFEPQLAPEDELRKKAVITLVRNITHALTSSPPENLDASDAPTCMAYGLALAVATGARMASVSGVGDADKIAACERILGMPAGAGIPVP